MKEEPIVNDTLNQRGLIEESFFLKRNVPQLSLFGIDSINSMHKTKLFIENRVFYLSIDCREFVKFC